MASLVDMICGDLEACLSSGLPSAWAAGSGGAMATLEQTLQDYLGEHLLPSDLA